MIWTIVRIVVYFIIFTLLQVLVMNHVHLFNIAIPFIYLYVVLTLPVNLSRSVVITVGFLLGLTVDVFSNTFGLHAAATTMMGFVRMPLLKGLQDKKEIPEDSDSIPSFRLMGFWQFLRYALVLVIVHHLVLFAVEAFTFFHPKMMLIRMSSSMLLSLLLMVLVEAFNLGAKD